MGHLFEIEERARIEVLRRQEQDKKKFLRLSALIMVDEGYPNVVIETALGISFGSVTNWKNRYKVGGLEKVLHDTYEGYSGRLSDEQRAELREYVSKTPCYTALSVVDWIENSYGIVYSVSGVTALLHELGFVYKSVRCVGHTVPSEAVQQEFIEKLEELAQASERGETEVYFVDGVHPTHTVAPHRCWVLRGEEHSIACNTGRQRVNLSGALSIKNQTDIVIHESERINSQATIALFEKLIERHGTNTITIVCDNARYYKSKEIRQWLSAHQQVHVVPLPAYCPHLNLIERVWKFLKKKVCRTFYSRFSEFQEAIRSFFAQIGSYKDELKSLLTMNFPIVQPFFKKA